MFRRLWQKIKELWARAKSERASPREIGWAVALGAFVGCTPAVGIRPWLAIGLATLLRKNRLFAYIASHTSNVLVMPFIAVAEVQIAHRARTGMWVDIDRHHIAEQAPTLLLDWCLGTIPVGLTIALVLGLLAYVLARRRDAQKHRAPAEELSAPEVTPTPAEAQPPSSGSPA